MALVSPAALDKEASCPVTRLLNRLQLPHQVVPRGQVPSASRLQVSLLSSGDECLCAIFSRDELLSLQAVQRVTGQPFRASPGASRELASRLQMKDLPALPQLLQQPCIVSRSLASLPVLYLESGRDDMLIAMPQAEFALCMKDALANHFTINLPPLPAGASMQSTDTITRLTVKRIEQRLGKTLEIPPLSLTAQRILQLRNKADMHVDDLTGIIETDPALSAQVMSWASSPYYAVPGKVRSIEDAIVRVLGFDLVMNLALGLALGKKFALPAEYLQENIAYWKTAVYSATLIEGLVRLMPKETRPEPGLAYLAGLLHNFGFLLLAHLFPSYFEMIQQHRAANPHVAEPQIDRSLLGISREEIATSLLHMWNLPEELVIAVANQHDATYAGEHAIYPRLVHLSRSLLSTQGIGSSWPGNADANMDAELYKQLGIEPDQALQAMERIRAAELALRSLFEQLGRHSA